MDEIVEKTLLYDFYGELLTENQKKIYGLYYLDDLSLGEISEQMNISRQGVHDALKRCENQLKNFENKLQLVAKFNRNRQRAENINHIACELKHGEYSLSSTLHEQIKNIEKLSKEIIEDL